MTTKQPISRRLFLTSASLAIAGLAVGAFYARSLFEPVTQVNFPKTVLRVGAFSTALDYAPFMIAKSKGWIDDALAHVNARAEYETFQTLPAINEALAGKHVDVMFEAEPPAIVAKAAGIDVRIIGISATLTIQAIAPASSPLKDVKDLNGKSIAVLAGSGAHYGIVKHLTEAGLKDTDYKILDLMPPDARAAFDSKQVDSWMVWSPWPEQEVVDARAQYVPGTETPIHSVVVVREEVLEKKAPVVEAFMSAIDRAKKWIIANPKEAKEIMASELSLPQKVVDLAWTRHDWSARLTDSVVTDIQAKGEFLVKLNFIKRVVSVKTELMNPMGDSK